jgi:hypothetical protein
MAQPGAVVEERTPAMSKADDDLERLVAGRAFERSRAGPERAAPLADRSTGGRPPFDRVWRVQAVLLQTRQHPAEAPFEPCLRHRPTWTRARGSGPGDAVRGTDRIRIETLSRAGAIALLLERLDQNARGESTPSPATGEGRRPPIARGIMKGLRASARWCRAGREPGTDRCSGTLPGRTRAGRRCRSSRGFVQHKARLRLFVGTLDPARATTRTALRRPQSATTSASLAGIPAGPERPAAPSRRGGRRAVSEHDRPTFEDRRRSFEAP